GLGEAVGAAQSFVFVGEIEKRWSTQGFAGAAVVQALVNVIGDDPDAMLAAMLQGGPLLGGAQAPAGRIVGRVDDKGAGAGRERIEQAIHVARPPIATESKRYARHVGAENPRNLGQARPQ